MPSCFNEQSGNYFPIFFQIEMVLPPLRDNNTQDRRQSQQGKGENKKTGWAEIAENFLYHNWILHLMIAEWNNIVYATIWTIIINYFGIKLF